MLVLTRRIGEKIVVSGCDGGIEIIVTAIKGERVRIGVTAPPLVRVDREEIHNRRVQLAPGPRLPTIGPTRPAAS